MQWLVVHTYITARVPLEQISSLLPILNTIFTIRLSELELKWADLS